MSLVVIRYTSGGGGSVPASSITGLNPKEILFGKSDGHIEQSVAFLYGVYLGVDTDGVLSVTAPLGSGKTAIVSAENAEPASSALFHAFDDGGLGAFFLSSRDSGASLLQGIDAGNNAGLVADDCASMEITPTGTTPSLGLGATGKKVLSRGTSSLQEGQQINSRSIAVDTPLSIADGVVVCTASLIATLPAIAADARGTIIRIVKSYAGGAPVTIAPSGLDTINGAAVLSLTQDFSAALVFVPAAGTDWIASVSLSSPASGALVQEFSVAGASVWNKPAGAKSVWVKVVGGGGGGGSGRVGVAATLRFGGGGGGGGGFSEQQYDANSLPASVALVIGAAGVGGARQATPSTNGLSGTAGGTSQFGNFLRASGGSAGSGGTNAAGTAGGGGVGWKAAGGNGGAGGSTNGTASVTASSLVAGPRGGGGGGGITVANALGNGGASGSFTTTVILTGLAGGVAPNGNGNNGVTLGNFEAAVAGAGGAATNDNAGGNGGTGIMGSGGGGGGAAADGNSSGRGGDGGAGYIVIITYF